VKGRSGGFGCRITRSLPTCAALILALVSAAPARAADDPWSQDANWVSVRFGYAKSAADLAPDGAVGYGFGFTHFIQNGVAWSAAVQHDLLGRYGDAAEVEVPFTVEFTKHMKWSESTRPYLGLGWGAFFHKTYRTGADESGFRQGIYIASGANAAIDRSSLIGFDLRIVVEQDTRSVNPTFPNRNASGGVWSAKLSYTRLL
jgi:hypothetical protein